MRCTHRKEIRTSAHRHVGMCRSGDIDRQTAGAGYQRCMQLAATAPQQFRSLCDTRRAHRYPAQATVADGVGTVYKYLLGIQCVSLAHYLSCTLLYDVVDIHDRQHEDQSRHAARDADEERDGRDCAPKKLLPLLMPDRNHAAEEEPLVPPASPECRGLEAKGAPPPAEYFSLS